MNLSVQGEISFEINNYKIQTFVKVRTDPIVITFSSWHQDNHPTVPRDFAQAFGFEPLASCGVNVISCISSRNDWYQDADFDAVLDAIRRYAAGSSKIVTYGSSMGGFAAINFSAYLGADCFVALSPQASISQRYLTSIGDRRWARESRLVSIAQDRILSGANAHSRGLILYDNYHRTDTLHAEECARRTSGLPVAISHGGHHVGSVVNKIYGLKEVIGEICNDRFNLEKFTKEITERNHSTLEFLAANTETLRAFGRAYRKNPNLISIKAIENLVDTVTDEKFERAVPRIHYARRLLQSHYDLFCDSRPRLNKHKRLKYRLRQALNYRDT